MKVGSRRRLKIMGATMTLATRVIFVGLIAWGFFLYTQNEWVMIKWPW